MYQHFVRNWVLALTAVCGIIVSSDRGYSAGPLAIQNATVVTVSDGTLENATVLIRDGRIEAVGVDVDIPGEAHVIDGSGKYVLPGYIDAHNAAGMSQANEQAAVVPFLSVVDSIDPVSSYFEECRRNGITTAAVVPGNSTLIGGKAAIVKTAGQYVNDMIVRRDSALKISLRPTSGSRMTHMAQLRKELDVAKKALEKESEDDSDSEDSETKKSKDDESDGDESDDEPEEDEQDPDEDKDGESDKDAEGEDNEKDEVEDAKDVGLEALKLALKGEMPVYVYCEVAMDVAAAVKLVDEYGLEPIFVLGDECYQAAKLLAKQKRTVVLDPTLVYWKTNPRTRQDEKIELPKIYNEADVSYIFQVSDSNRRTTLGTSYFWYQAASAVKCGLDEDKALAALTIEPAKLLGIDDRIGSIEAGKEADLVVLTGPPLDIATWVQTTIVGGEVVYERDEDEKLKRLLSPEAE